MPSHLIVHPGRPLRGIVGPTGRFALPGDKSLSHRAALFAALADGENRGSSRGMSRIENFLVSGVTVAMLNALTALGVRWELDGTTLTIEGKGLHGFEIPAAPIDCGNSGTTLRLLAGAIAASGTAAVLDGSGGLRKRPMGRVVTPLQQMGVPIRATEDGTAPLRLDERPFDQPLKPITYTLPVASAQVKTALLLAALSAPGQTTLLEPGPSRDHTERMLHSMGVAVDSKIESGVYVTQIHGLPTNLQPLNLRLPCDISSAAFLIVAALITPGSDLTIEGVGLNPTRTGLVDALQRMGANLHVIPGAEQGGEPCGTIVARASVMSGCEISGELVVRMIDEFPAFTVAAAYARGTTLVRDAQELRYKESDRISALCGELRSLGGDVQETADGFVLHGGKPLTAGTVDPHGDHRLAMSLALAGLAAEGPVDVLGAEIIHESFPEFAPILEYLGADLTLE